MLGLSVPGDSSAPDSHSPLPVSSFLPSECQSLWGDSVQARAFADGRTSRLGLSEHRWRPVSRSLVCCCECIWRAGCSDAHYKGQSDQEALSMAAPAASPAPPYVPASPLPMRSAAEHCIPTFVPSQHGGSFDNAISQNLSSATPGAARSSSASVPSHQALPPAVPLSGPRDTFSMRMQDPVWRMWMDHWFTMDIKVSLTTCL